MIQYTKSIKNKFNIILEIKYKISIIRNPNNYLSTNILPNVVFVFCFAFLFIFLEQSNKHYSSLIFHQTGGEHTPINHIYHNVELSSTHSLD